MKSEVTKKSRPTPRRAKKNCSGHQRGAHSWTSPRAKNGTAATNTEPPYPLGEKRTNATQSPESESASEALMARHEIRCGPIKDVKI